MELEESAGESLPQSLKEKNWLGNQQYLCIYKKTQKIEFAILMLQLIGTLSAIAVLSATVNSGPSGGAISAKV